MLLLTIDHSRFHLTVHFDSSFPLSAAAAAAPLAALPLFSAPLSHAFRQEFVMARRRGKEGRSRIWAPRINNSETDRVGSMIHDR